MNAVIAVEKKAAVAELIMKLQRDIKHLPDEPEPLIGNMLFEEDD